MEELRPNTNFNQEDLPDTLKNRILRESIYSIKEWLDVINCWRGHYVGEDDRLPLNTEKTLFTIESLIDKAKNTLHIKHATDVVYNFLLDALDASLETFGEELENFMNIDHQVEQLQSFYDAMREFCISYPFA